MMGRHSWRWWARKWPQVSQTNTIVDLFMNERAGVKDKENAVYLTRIITNLDYVVLYCWRTGNHRSTMTFDNSLPAWKQAHTHARMHARTHTHTGLMALCLRLPWWGNRKVKAIWILLKQEIVSGWAICKSALHSRQIAMPAPHHSVFYRLDALPAAQPTASKHWRPRLFHVHCGKTRTPAYTVLIGRWLDQPLRHNTSAPTCWTDSSTKQCRATHDNSTVLWHH